LARGREFLYNKIRIERQRLTKGTIMVEDLPPVGKAATPRKASRARSAGGSPITRLRSWLIDTYNGLFRIVILPQLPKPKLLLVITLSFLAGLTWAYVIVPAQFYDASVSQLSRNQRDLYLILVSGSYQAGFYDSTDIVNLLSQVEDPAGSIERLIQQQTGQVQASLQELLPLAQQAGPGTPAPPGGDIVTEVLTIVAAVIIFIVVVNVIALLWGLLIGGFVERFAARLKPETDADRRAKATIEDIRRRKELELQMRQESTAGAGGSPLGPPIMQRISTYTKGRAYDDSFAIEDANDMFLGECGATIAKTIGDTQELAAVEIWLFDKEDFVRTLTKIFVSEHAYNDPVIRSELEPKVEDPANDLVIVRPGATLSLETNQLVVQAKIANLEFGTGPLPPNSHFEALTIQMQAWEKAGAPVPAATAAGAASTGLPPVDSYEIGPAPTTPPQPYQPAPQPYEQPPPQPYEQPPQPYEPSPQPYGQPQPFEQPPQSAPQPPPSAPPESSPPGMRPLSPPPMQPPGQFFDEDEEEDDDDPFGGTGDFTPINR
jgi:hypothetical protein